MTDLPSEPDVHGDAGVTLVELLVAMAVSSLLLVSLSSVFSASLRGAAEVRDKTTTNAEVRLAADVMARRLRVAAPASTTAPAFLTMTAGEVSFTASVQDADWITTPAQAAQDPPLTTVTYRHDAVLGCLVETLTATSGASRTTCLLRGAAPSDTAFTYYAAPSGTAAASQPTDVRSVGVTVTSTTATTGRAAASTVVVRVTCPNTVPMGG